MPYPAYAEPQLGMASYHSQIGITQNTFAQFANRGGVLTTIGDDVSSGAFGSNDYYIRPVEKGMWRNPGNRMIHTDAGYRAIPPHLQTGYTPSYPIELDVGRCHLESLLLLVSCRPLPGF